MRTQVLAALAVLGLQLASPAPAAAQLATPPSASVSRLVAGGLLGGAAGALAGGLAGFAVGGNRCDDEGNPDSCRGLEGAAIGTVAGEALGIPLGVHMAGGRRGRLAPSMAASAVIAAVGVGAILASKEDGVAVGVALSVPVVQIVASTWIERATARRQGV